MQKQAMRIDLKTTSWKKNENKLCGKNENEKKSGCDRKNIGGDRKRRSATKTTTVAVELLSSVHEQIKAGAPGNDNLESFTNFK